VNHDAEMRKERQGDLGRESGDAKKGVRIKLNSHRQKAKKG